MALSLEKRYALAFLNVFSDLLTPQILSSATMLYNYMKKHRRISFMLKLSVLQEQIKIEGLHKLCGRFNLPEPFKRLITVLQDAHRLPLFADILSHLEALYMERKQIYPFTVHSAGELASDERSIIEEFLAQRVTGTILSTYHTDEKLIAGIRAQSPTYLWGHSVARQLRCIETALSRQGCQWN